MHARPTLLTRCATAACVAAVARLLALAALLALMRIGAAQAVPAFALQTGQPCAACHVGAFGPQLTPFGRDFKLNGYLASDGKKHGLPVALTSQISFTHTQAPQPGGAAPDFGPNNNFAADQTSFYYAGRITPWLGAFVQITYDGVAKQGHIDNTDIRHARDGELFGEDMVWGLTVNNNPTVSDLWNSTPVWGFPYNSSALAPTPAAAAVIDGALGQMVAGGGAYMMWNDLVYVEADAYKGLSAGTLNATGIVPVQGADRTSGLIPYWRLALKQDWKQHHVEFGTYGLAADIIPGGVETTGMTDNFVDTALDANYQYFFNPDSVVGDVISAHATYIHEAASLRASQALAGALARHSLDEFRADVSFSYAATITPTVQYFHVGGTTDAAYFGTANGSPNSDGIIAEIAYVPWGKPDSPLQWLNLKLALQYVDYFHFNGTHVHASDNNTLYLSLWTAMHF